VRIAEARAYQQWQPFRDGTYWCSGGVADGFDSTIVALVADNGTIGWGEAAPLGAFYAPAFPAGVHAGVGELLPLVVGRDATSPRALLRRLDAAMMGQPAAKSAIDMAACDLAARLAGVPLAEALGGRDGESVELYRSVVSEPPAAMAERARG
jgi:cis-L-3-hydroxyproline dehydratase